MENKKDKVALNDELLDKVSGGDIIDGEHDGMFSGGAEGICSCGRKLESDGCCSNPACPNSPFYNVPPTIK